MERVEKSQEKGREEERREKKSERRKDRREKNSIKCVVWKRKHEYRERWGEVKRTVEEKEEKAGNITRERRGKRRKEAKRRQD